MTDDEPLAVVVLAAGGGTRMRSAIPKVLHRIAGRTLLEHVLAAASPLGAQHTVVVVGHGRDSVIDSLPGSGITPVVQAQQRGTGHATRLAMAAIPDFGGTVLVLLGDTPLLLPDTLARLLDEHRAAGAAGTVLTADAPDPSGYGRVILDERGTVVRIVEHRDATASERMVTRINTGIMAFQAAALRPALARISADNVAGEEYLPDAVGALVAGGGRVIGVSGRFAETAGVNDRVQLAAAGAALRDRLCEAWMRAGVTMIDPASTWIDTDVTLAPDVTIYPGVQLHGVTAIETNARIGPDSTLVDTRVGAGALVVRAHAVGADIGPQASVGPYAYLRPGTVLRRGSKVGTYVEVKSAEIGEGSKVPHLSYVGDATIGAGVNIGASSVFANYDGEHKRRSVVEDHAHTGADNTFVAPVRVGAGSYTGAGAVIREDVPPGSLAVSSGAVQRVVAGWTRRKRPGTAAARAAESAPGGDSDPEGVRDTERAPDSGARHDG